MARKDPPTEIVGEITRTEHLAIIRTELANQRTVLAFARTALMLFGTGFTFIKVFADDSGLVTLGIIMLPLAVIASVAGLWSFLVSRKLIYGSDSRPRSLRSAMQTYFRRVDRVSASVLFADSSKRGESVQTTESGREVLAVVGALKGIPDTVGKASGIARAESSKLVVWIHDGISTAEAEEAIKAACDPEVRWIAETIPGNESRIVKRRLRSRSLSSVVIDSWSEHHWIGGYLQKIPQVLPVLVVARDTAEARPR